MIGFYNLKFNTPNRLEWSSRFHSSEIIFFQGCPNHCLSFHRTNCFTSQFRRSPHWSAIYFSRQHRSSPDRLGKPTRSSNKVWFAAGIIARLLWLKWATAFAFANSWEPYLKFGGINPGSADGIHPVLGDDGRARCGCLAFENSPPVLHTFFIRIPPARGVVTLLWENFISSLLLYQLPLLRRWSVSE